MSCINRMKLSPLTIFLIKAGLIYGGWEVLYQYVLLPDFWLDTWLVFILNFHEKAHKVAFLIMGLLSIKSKEDSVAIKEILS